MPQLNFLHLWQVQCFAYHIAVAKQHLYESMTSCKLLTQNSWGFHIRILSINCLFGEQKSGLSIVTTYAWVFGIPVLQLPAIPSDHQTCFFSLPAWKTQPRVDLPPVTKATLSWNAFPMSRWRQPFAQSFLLHKALHDCLEAMYPLLSWPWWMKKTDKQESSQSSHLALKLTYGTSYLTVRTLTVRYDKVLCTTWKISW